MNFLFTLTVSWIGLFVLVLGFILILTPNAPPLLVFSGIMLAIAGAIILFLAIFGKNKDER